MAVEDADSVAVNSDDEPDLLSRYDSSSFSRSQNSPSIPAEGDWIEAAELDSDRWVKAEDLDQLWGEAAIPKRRTEVNNLNVFAHDSNPDMHCSHTTVSLQQPAVGSGQQQRRASMPAMDTLDIFQPAHKRARLSASPIRVRSPALDTENTARQHSLVPVHSSADLPAPTQPANKEETVLTEAAAGSDSDTGSSGDVSASMRQLEGAGHADVGSPLSGIVGSASGDEQFGRQEAQASSRDFDYEDDSESSDGFEGVPSCYCINCTSRMYPGDVLCLDCGHAPSHDDELFDQRPSHQAAASQPTQRVVLAYDERMTLHVEGQGSSHPERPDRIRAVMARLTASGLIDQCQRLPVREATAAEVIACHSSDHMARVAHKADMAAADAMTGGVGRTHFSPDTYLNQHTMLCARLAAGACADTAVAVVRQEASTGVAIVRPPGHHAESNTAMGFCFFNNAAIAARAAQAAGAERVLILDWDVHHGNGTQEIFEDDPTVMYMSIHRHDRGMFYPGTGAHDAVGTGPGKGFSVNVPWLTGDMGNGDYLAAFQHVLLPVAYEFNPSLVIVSAGFDAAVGDPIGGCKVTEECFGHMTAMLQPIAPMAVLLEGGYNLSATAASTEACLKVLLGQRPTALPFEDRAPSAIGLAVIQQVIRTQAKYWSCLRGLVPILAPVAPVRTDHRLYTQVDAVSAADLNVAAASTQYYKSSSDARPVVSVSLENDAVLPQISAPEDAIQQPEEALQQPASRHHASACNDTVSHANHSLHELRPGIAACGSDDDRPNRQNPDATHSLPASLHGAHQSIPADTSDNDRPSSQHPPDIPQKSHGSVHAGANHVRMTDQSSGHRLLADGQKPQAHGIAPKVLHRTKPGPEMCLSKSHRHLLFMTALHASAQKQVQRQHKHNAHYAEMSRQESA